MLIYTSGSNFTTTQKLEWYDERGPNIKAYNQWLLFRTIGSMISDVAYSVSGNPDGPPGRSGVKLLERGHKLMTSLMPSLNSKYANLPGSDRDRRPLDDGGCHGKALYTGQKMSLICGYS